MTQTELNLRILQHQLWLEKKTGGKRFILLNENLKGLELGVCNLNEAHLLGCNCEGVDFTCVNLYGTRLLGSNMREAKFSNISFMHSNIINTKF